MPTTPYVESSNDTLIGAIDGVNNIFTLALADPYPGSVQGYINPQIVQITAIPGTSRSFQFSQTPAIGDTVSIAYSSYAITTGSGTTLLAVINRALLRIGAAAIGSWSENSANAIKVRAVYYACVDEVMQRNGVDWTFAKTRVALVQSASTPLYGYKYAYAMPDDYLHLVSPKQKRSRERREHELFSRHHQDQPVYPEHAHPYVIEMLNGALCLLTNFNNSCIDLIINYIRRETDSTLYPPLFASALAYRIASDLVFAITNDKQLLQSMEQLYEDAFEKAVSSNNSNDYEDEIGSDSWVEAGRW